jgi:hypothetical protein
MADLNQRNVDIIFKSILNQEGDSHYKHCELIRDVLKDNLNIQLSIAEAEYFWMKYSEDQEAYFLIVKPEDKDLVVEGFKGFFNDWFYNNL